MPEVVFPLDSQKKFTEQQIVGHNRWHPDIPAQVHVKPGDSFRVHCREWFDGAIVNDDSADDILQRALAGVHMLCGPIAVEGAEPGDLLIVDILDVGPIPQEDSGPLAGQGWGYTGVFATPQRWRLPHRAVPRRLQGDLGLPRRRGHLAARPRGVVHRHRPPGPDGHRALGGPAGQVERPRAGPDRHRPEPGAAAGAAAAARTRPSSAASPAPSSTGSPPRPPAPHRRGRTAATRTSRTSPRAAASSTRCSSTARSSRWVTCTSPRATARSRSAARSRWAGSWTCTST